MVPSSIPASGLVSMVTSWGPLPEALPPTALEAVHVPLKTPPPPPLPDAPPVPAPLPPPVPPLTPPPPAVAAPAPPPPIALEPAPPIALEPPPPEPAWLALPAVIPALAPAVLEIPPVPPGCGSSEVPQPGRAKPSPASPEIQRSDFTVIIDRSPVGATAA